MSRLAPWLVGPTVKKSVGSMARQFITGRTGAEAVPVLKKIRARKVGFTVDILGEAVVSEKRGGGILPPLPRTDRKPRRRGEALGALRATRRRRADSAHAEGQRVGEDFRAVLADSPGRPGGRDRRTSRNGCARCSAARRNSGVFINLDMENYGLKNLTLAPVREPARRAGVRRLHDAGIVIQAYLRDCARRHRAAARAGPRRARGASRSAWSKARTGTTKPSWPGSAAGRSRCGSRSRRATPITSGSPAGCSNRTSGFIRRSARTTSAAWPTRSPARDKLGLDRHAYEIQMLYGMAEPIKKALVQLGHRIREYCPVGEMLPGMAYLVRRLLENTSNEGFLKAKFTTQVASTELLRDPLDLVLARRTRARPPARTARRQRRPPAARVDGATAQTVPTASAQPTPPCPSLSPTNRPPISRSKTTAGRCARRWRPSARRSARITRWSSAADTPTSGQWIDSVNPSKPDGNHRPRRGAPRTSRRRPPSMPPWPPRRAGARRRRSGARRSWKRWPTLMREERFRLGGAGSLRGRQGVGRGGRATSPRPSTSASSTRRKCAQLGRPQATFAVPGENSMQEYIPRGVGLVIAPWNFPLAILCGMTVAALVTGNTVVMKPAEQSSITAARFMDLARARRAAAGRAESAHRPRRGSRRVSGQPSEDRFHRVHRLEGSRPENLGGRRPDAAGSGAVEEAWSARWAARTRSSSTRTPTSTRRCSARCIRRSATRGRSARRCRG